MRWPLEARLPVKLSCRQRRQLQVDLGRISVAKKPGSRQPCPSQDPLQEALALEPGRFGNDIEVACEALRVNGNGV